jgi:predicted ATPase/transcriptional regulator with GAF, ATPase, and Fis domain
VPLLLTGYEVEAQLHDGRKRAVYRARRARDHAPVILKTLTAEFPTPADTAALRREFQILQSLDAPGVARALDLQGYRDRLVLVLEDAGDTTLKALCAAAPLDTLTVLDYARQLAAALAAVHRAGLIHKDITSNNVIVDRNSGRVTLSDFGIASRARSEQHGPGLPHMIEGTLAYMSPEQTGRMNRDLDHRGDLYSLGVVCYEMLTGRLPFESADPLELIHSHVAQAPAAPAALVPGVPQLLSDLVLRLLAKNAEDRYQSAAGVEADLTRCLEAWTAADRIEPFTLGQDDLRDRFTIPQRLYGREVQVARLVEAFERVAGGRTELVLVSGHTGIGKTAVIQETYRSLAKHRGRYTGGKFDQLARDVPYAALAQAFQSLLRHLLSETDDQLAVWRERLQEALGSSSQVVIDVIPELGILLGPQPPVPPLGPTESQIRFNLVFQQFLKVFARPEHPLVLFLDDLQWADAATLGLLPLFLDNPEITGLLVIGAYRDNEVTPSHPLAGLIRGLRTGGPPFTELTLEPLAPAHVHALLSETLGAGSPVITPLGELVQAKTGGNPFFMIQFLKALHQDGRLAYDRASRSWQADLAAIRDLAMTENVVDLMAGRLQRLEDGAQRMLRLAACVGSRFDLGTLATVSQSDPLQAVSDLWSAVEQGLVLPEEQSYGVPPDPADGRPVAQRRFRFLHDRVQQAAYALTPEGDRRAAHLTIGRLLLARGDDGTRSEWLFDVVNQLDYGAELIRDPAERGRLAELNLAAGRKAKASGAFPGALSYFTSGTSVLAESAWEDAHELAHALHLERAVTQYLCGRFADAEAGFAELLPHCRSLEERTSVFVAIVAQFETMARYQDAIHSALEGLRELGVVLPEDDVAQQAALAEDVAAIRRMIAERPVAGLVDLPPLTDPAIQQAMRLLRSTWAPAFISTSGNLCAVVAARMVRLSLEHGNSADSAFGYLHHAITVGSLLGEYPLGFEFGELALALNERLADVQLRAVIHHRFAALVNPWCRSFASCLAHAERAVVAGLETGELQVAGYAQFQQSWYGMLLEPDLAGFHARYAPVADFLTQLQSPAFLATQRLILQWAEALQGRTESSTGFTGAAFDEDAFLGSFGKIGIFSGMYATLKLELLHSAGRVAEARALARASEQAVELFFGTIWPAIFVFRHLLVLCAWLPGAPEDERPEAEATLDRLLARLTRWADHAPENFSHWALLAGAEVSRVRGRVAEAIAGYEAALAATALQPSPRHRALANELYGEFWLERQQPKVAAVFLAEARFGYGQWGAETKVQELQRRHGTLLHSTWPVRTGPREAATLQTTLESDSAFDLASVMKAAQALTAEIDLEPLLGRLMRAAIENAGAERGHIVLEHEGAPAVHVSGTITGVSVHGGLGIPLSEARDLPRSVLDFVRRSRQTVVLAEALEDTTFAADPYFTRTRPRSVICLPVVHQARLTGALYLENNLTAGVFTPGHTQVLQILASQAAIALENARLFAEIRRLKDRLHAENVYLKEEIRTQHNFEEIVGRSPALRRVLGQVEQVAPTDTTVLITGETGTGKELVARAVHNLSRRKERPIVTVNCGAISPGLVESELFGHEKGAFTGAIARKVGRFELADGGTLFLDEIGDLAPDLQVKLLRVLQEGEIDRVGGARGIRVNVRVIAATHRNLAELVDQGRFRADLYYRLNVFPIRMPALRERREDIPLLVRYLVLKYAQKLGKRIESIPTEAMEPLCAYDWPGNIRELGNVLERSVIVSRGPALELGEWITAGRALRASGAEAQRLNEVEREHILATLERTGWKVSGPRGAAALLGLKATTLESRMKKLGIKRPG